MNTHEIMNKQVYAPCNGYQIPIREYMDLPAGRNSQINQHSLSSSSIQANCLHESSSIAKMKDKDFTTKNNNKKMQLFEKQSHIRQMKTICKQLKFSNKNLSTPGFSKAAEKLKGRVLRDSQKRNQYAKLMIKNSFDKSKEKINDITNQTENADTGRFVLLSNNPSKYIADSETEDQMHKRCLSYNNHSHMKAVFESDNFGEYQAKVAFHERNKSQVAENENSYVPLDKILRELIFTHHQPTQIPNFSSYYSKENFNKMSKLKPQTAGIAKRSENSRKI